MKHLAMSALALFSALAVIRADGQEKAGSPGEQYEAIVEEYEKARQDFFRDFQAAKTVGERQAIIGKQPQLDKYAERFMALADKHPGDDASARALVWVASNIRTPATQDEALSRLQKDYLENPSLADACLRLSRSRAQRAESFLRNVLENSPHENVQGMACYSLGKILKQKVSMLEYLQSQPEMAAQIGQIYGQKFADSLKGLEIETVNAEIEKMFERAAKRYADVSIFDRKLGDVAERELFEIRFLAIGKEAPEIQGEDIDGVEFKLSDYRGKVVVLDFWGNW